MTTLECIALRSPPRCDRTARRLPREESHANAPLTAQTNRWHIVVVWATGDRMPARVMRPRHMYHAKRCEVDRACSTPEPCDSCVPQPLRSLSGSVDVDSTYACYSGRHTDQATVEKALWLNSSCAGKLDPDDACCCAARGSETSIRPRARRDGLKATGPR